MAIELPDNEDLCSGSDTQLIQDGCLAACPDCGFMIKVHLVNGLWTFVAHDRRGVA